MMRADLGLMLLLVVGLNIAAPPAAADPGDKRGWATLTDPRKRAFLIYAAKDDGPRLLTIACLRDADYFSVFSEDAGGFHGEMVPLVLTNGAARYAIEGEVTRDSDSNVKLTRFGVDLDADAKALVGIRAQLMPVLTGPGPIQMSIGPRRAKTLGPTTGLAEAVKTFSTICFGG